VKAVWGHGRAPFFGFGCVLGSERGLIIDAVGMWKSRSDFQGRWETMGNLILVFLVFHRPAFPRCSPVFHALFRSGRKPRNSFLLASCIRRADSVSLCACALRYYVGARMFNDK
jgi:hypothetical protein